MGKIVGLESPQTVTPIRPRDRELRVCSDPQPPGVWTCIQARTPISCRSEPEYQPQKAPVQVSNIPGKETAVKVVKNRKLLKSYFGRDFASKGEFLEWLRQNYRVQSIGSLRQFEIAFHQWTVGWGLPTRVMQGQLAPSLPFVYLFGFTGLFAAALCRGPLRPYRLLWGLLGLFQAFVLFSASSLRARYRLAYEPWFFLGLFCPLELLLLLVLNCWKDFSLKKHGALVAEQVADPKPPDT